MDLCVVYPCNVFGALFYYVERIILYLALTDMRVHA